MNMGETPIRSTNLYVPEDTFSYPTFYLVLITTLCSGAGTDTTLSSVKEERTDLEACSGLGRPHQAI